MEEPAASGDKKNSSSDSRQEFESRPPRPLLNRRRSMEAGVSGSKEVLPSRFSQEFDSRPSPSLSNQKKETEVKATMVMKELDHSRPRPRSMELGKDHILISHPAAKELESARDREAPKSSSRRVWDCGSTLYDSFELNSFKRELDSAISCRTMSMPHLSDRRAPLSTSSQPPTVVAISAKKPSKLSRSLNKFLRSIFKPKADHSAGAVYRVKEPPKNIKDGFYVVYDKSGALTTIPEVVPHELDHFSRDFSPEIGSLVRRTGSERFTSSASASIGISCA